MLLHFFVSFFVIVVLRLINYVQCFACISEVPSFLNVLRYFLMFLDIFTLSSTTLNSILENLNIQGYILSEY